MELPPGPAHLLHLFPYFVIPSAVSWAFLKLLGNYVLHALPSWLIILISILSRPILLFVQMKYSNWMDRKAAAAHGAVLAPVMEESPLAIISEFVAAFDGYPGDVMLRWSKKYGNSVQFSLLTNTTLSTIEPEHVKAILSTQFDAFEKGPLLISQIRSLLGTGVFNSDGMFHRAITRPFFTRERISDFQIYERMCEPSFAEAKKRLAEGYPVDFQDLTARFTLDSSTAFLFGSSVDSLAAGIPYPQWDAKKNPPSFYNHPSNKFVSAFSEGLALAAFRLGRGGEWPLFEFLKDKIIPFRKIIDDFTEPLLREALAKREIESAVDKSHTDAEEDTLLAHLIKQTQAGRDSVMCLLSYSLYMVLEHPDVEKRLRQEIFEKIGPTGIPTYEQIREMKYMRAFLNALKFDPDRFLDQRLHKYLSQNPYIFCPFNAGPRVCLGQQFAYNEASFYLVRLLQQFTHFTLDKSANTPPHIAWASEAGLKSKEQIHPMSHLTMSIKGGLWVRMNEFNDN
ncbi:cytochrome P450 [Gymnopilus junonius]|uniref:Cytochrome P450 n=1 Tax=Gymnopilus junonius TaxID=109634 RepID=A0A9P5NVC6_GYMJU|nr:cytochrome P450 [Gymnopilus junonius]